MENTVSGQQCQEFQTKHKCRFHNRRIWLARLPTVPHISTKVHVAAIYSTVTTILLVLSATEQSSWFFFLNSVSSVCDPFSISVTSHRLIHPQMPPLIVTFHFFSFNPKICWLYARRVSCSRTLFLGAQQMIVGNTTQQRLPPDLVVPLSWLNGHKSINLQPPLQMECISLSRRWSIETRLTRSYNTGMLYLRKTTRWNINHLRPFWSSRYGIWEYMVIYESIP
jgi:hypothetical protein